MKPERHLGLGAPWVKTIPEGWQIRRVKYSLVSIEQGWSPDCEARLAEEDEWGVLKAGCVNYGHFREEEHKALPSELAPRARYEVRPGDVLMSRANTKELLGSAALVGDVRPRLLLCDKLYRLEFTGDTDRRFLVLALNDHSVRAQHVMACSGASASMQNISQEKVRDLVVCVPPLPAQRATATFLDRKTAAIDDLIEKKERLITLLAEKRAALIHQAVTKGLDPNVPMKDSGVPWIGEIPANWDLLQLRRKIQLQRGVDITKEQQREGRVPVVSSGGVSSYHDTPYAKGPGVLVGRKGSAGRVHYAEDDYWPHDTTLWVREFRGNSPRYVYYKLVSMKLESFDTGSANPTVNRNLVHPTKVSWPPLTEQEQIALSLDRESQRIDEATGCLRLSCDRLREYRQALITAAVTGQLQIHEEEAA